MRALLRGGQPEEEAPRRERTSRTPVIVPILRAVRKALGVGLKEFACLAGISESHLANIETGKRRASRKMQRKLVSAVARLQAEHPERWQRVKDTAC